jgi:hypothetical protein
LSAASHRTVRASHRIVRRPGAAVLVAVVAVAAGISQTSVGHAILQNLGILQTPSTYTSLAFAHPQSLPERLRLPQENVNVSFVVHNASNVLHDYRWSVFLAHNGRTRRVDTGELRVASGQGVAITRPVGVSCTGGRVRIVVNLVGAAPKAESIDFWTACWSPGS